MATGVDAKLLKSTKFPPEFNQKVDMQKVNLQVMKKWIASKISDILGSEDDVVIELCFNLIEGSRYPDIKSLQIQLTGFLDKDTAPFCKDLWKLCLSAQTSPQGVPKELLEAKKLELIQEKMEADRAADEARRRREDNERREQEAHRLRDRDRGERGRGRGGDTWRGRRGDRDHDQRGRYGPRFDEHRSRSPGPRHRDQRDRGSFRGSARDSYVPRDKPSGGRGSGRRRPNTRSPSTSASSRSPSRSRSTERKRELSRAELIIATRGGNEGQQEVHQRGHRRPTDDQPPSGAGTPRLGVVPPVTKDDPAADPQVQHLYGAPGLWIEAPSTVRIVAVQIRGLAVAPEAAARWVIAFIEADDPQKVSLTLVTQTRSDAYSHAGRHRHRQLAVWRTTARSEDDKLELALLAAAEANHLRSFA
ncbi:hypothetical protein CSUB01_02495 [Colletotrichum sublineola]|uniref:PWI domain-containing protein n=1 Tax=Colletotrichum sublineola TaxID=1173701 RepID=A0A066XR13_COLSU|nr:hypothetical protein CSUB01_02495 [Colletotrichum sublineola]